MYQPLKRIAVSLIAGSVLTSGAAAASDIPARVVPASGDPVTFSRVTARPDNGGILVRGYVSRPFGSHGVLTGHIAVAAVDEPGGIVSTGRAALGQVPTRSPRRTTFVVRLSIPRAAQVRLITVRYQGQEP